MYNLDGEPSWLWMNETRVLNRDFSLSCLLQIYINIHKHFI